MELIRLNDKLSIPINQDSCCAVRRSSVNLTDIKIDILSGPEVTSITNNAVITWNAAFE